VFPGGKENKNMNSYDCFASAEASQQDALDRNPQLEAMRSLDWLKNQARFGVPVWAVCTGCTRSRLLDAADLLSVVKPEVTQLTALQDRMRCRACGSKACELRAATPVPEYFA
jgi:hypothetical protein